MSGTVLWTLLIVYTWSNALPTTTIPGFTSQESCRAAIEQIRQAAGQGRGSHLRLSDAFYVCVEVR